MIEGQLEQARMALDVLVGRRPGSAEMLPKCAWWISVPFGMRWCLIMKSSMRLHASIDCPARLNFRPITCFMKTRIRRALMLGIPMLLSPRCSCYISRAVGATPGYLHAAPPPLFYAHL